MRRRFRLPLSDIFNVSAGWLFADLLLALAMVFLLANTVNTKPPPTPPVVKKTTVAPTATPLPQLELTAQKLTLTVDDAGLLNNSSDAISSVKQQVRSQMSSFKGRRAGFVLAYGGAPTDGDVQHAFAVASKVMSILQTFEPQKFIFIKTAYHDPLFRLGDDSTKVVLEIYLYKQI